MSNFTQKAIKQAFWELLHEAPYNQISVRRIVERCGINRNSFYYHYQDIPSLLTEILTEYFDVLLAKYPDSSSLPDCCSEALQYALENKAAILHLWNSVKRDTFEKYLMYFCEYAVVTYLHTAMHLEIDSDDRILLVRLLKCELFGLMNDWFENKMPPDIAGQFIQMLKICHGMAAEMIQWYKKSVTNDECASDPEDEERGLACL